MHLRTTTLSLLFVASFSAFGIAAEPWQKWMSFFEGTWTYEVDGQTRQWEFRLLPGGRAGLGETKNPDGTTRSVQVGGYESASKAVVDTGYGADGSYWKIVYKDIGEDSYSGTYAIRVDAEGKKAKKATVRIEKIDQDTARATINAVSADGEVRELIVTYKRMK